VGRRLERVGCVRFEFSQISELSSEVAVGDRWAGLGEGVCEWWLVFVAVLAVGFLC